MRAAVARTRRKVGLARGAVVTGGRDAGVALVDNPKVAKIGFIGSVGAGRAVMQAAGRSLKALTRELGGKNALIGCPDAGIDELAEGVVRGMNFRYVTGQSCNSTPTAPRCARCGPRLSRPAPNLLEMHWH